MERLAGIFRDGLCGPQHVGSPEVVWTDGGAQLVLHVGKLQVRTVDSTLLVAIDTESAEFGTVPLLVRFVFGAEGGPASLVAATDAKALGHPQVAGRWGDLFRDVIWASFARVIEVEGGGNPPTAIKVGADQLSIAFEGPFSVVDLAHAHVRDLVDRGVRPATRRREDLGDAGAVR